jgi:hypothetical protein
VVEPEFSVTLKIKGSKLETMATAAKKIGVEVVKVRKASVSVPPTGEWKLTEDNSANEHNRHYRCKVWSNPDGREIIWEPAYEEDDEKVAENFKTQDDWGKIGDAPTLEEAQALVREVATTEELLDDAEDLAKAVLNDEPLSRMAERCAENILANRGIAKPEPKDEIEENPRRKPQYIVTLTIEAHRLSAVEKKAKAAFGDSVRVEKVSRHFSRNGDLMSAKEKFEEGATIIAHLKEDMEHWREGMEGTNLENSAKFSDVEECASKLDDLSNEADSVVNGCDNVEFPGR